MTRRPILCLNGKPTRYKTLYVALIVQGFSTGGCVEIDGKRQHGTRASFGRRPSGRRIVWVHVPEVVKL